MWLEWLGHASLVRVVCYVLVASVFFWGGFRRPGYKWVSFSLALWFAITISIPFVISIGRSDLLWQQRGLLTIAAVVLATTVAAYVVRDIRRSARHSGRPAQW